MRIDDCTLINFSQIVDPRGKLSILENNAHIPFAIQRIFYIYDVPGDLQRGGHAHREQQQVLIAMSGSFDVVLNDGFNQKEITLNHPNQGLYIHPLVWDELKNFSSDAVCLVLASGVYDEEDYIREQKQFLELVRG